MPLPPINVNPHAYKIDTFQKYPAILAGSGSVQAAGNTVTLTNTLGLTFSLGCWLYLPTIATTGITAGWYFVIMSSGTLGSIKGTGQTYPNNTPDTTQFDVLADSAFTGVSSGTEVAIFNMPMPISLGDRGKLKSRHGAFKMATTGTNVVRSRVGSSSTPSSNSSMLAPSLANATLSQVELGYLQATATNQQFTVAQATPGLIGSTNAPQLLTIDTSATWYYAVTIEKANAAEWVGVLFTDTWVEL